jgi:hypothetical protein
MLIFYKTVDKSVLVDGFSIPIVYKEMLFERLGFSLAHGEKMPIDILIGGEVYKATLINIGFNQKDHPNHKDLLQIRYSAKSTLAVKLQSMFGYTQALIRKHSDVYSYKWLSALPEAQKEFIAIYSTNNRGVLMLDCITNSDFQEESKELVSLGEVAAERVLDGTDPNSGIFLKTKVCKIRHLTATILRDLKVIYGYRCQVCGQYIGEKYDSNLIHAHHIDYFTKSLNNNASNIMILCPNHHGIIHDKNPIFNAEDKTFLYPNGFKEGLKLNLHL